MPLLSGCGGAAPVPEWKDPPPVSAAPGATGRVAAPDGGESSAGGPGGVSGGPPGLDGEEFVDAVRGELPAVAMDRRGEEITELGGQACASLAAGHDRGEVAAELGGYGLAAADARRLVTLARTTLCRG
ncbi:DUF732 domain-containing protein [Actinoplanes sp. NPDC049802]|uniref:DUF732 domain-containing protein n=1 Tax=Actinoplanes sp. NPDC049802 TaxID=3154742 RepID=UPI0033F8347B